MLIGNTECAVANTIPLKKIVAAPRAATQLSTKTLARNQAKQAITQSNYTVFSGFNSFHRPVTFRDPSTINYLPPTIIGDPISTGSPGTVNPAASVPDTAQTAALLGGTLGALLLWSRRLKASPSQTREAAPVATVL
jgi:hypothetical protein